MSVLYDFPELPAQEHIDFLTQSFTRIFAHDAFVNTLPISSQSQQVTVPFFKLSLACLACAALPDNMVSVDRRDLARRLFFAGNSLWNVMLEVDNTEARTLEGALSVRVTVNAPLSRTQRSADMTDLADASLNVRRAQCRR